MAFTQVTLTRPYRRAGSGIPVGLVRLTPDRVMTNGLTVITAPVSGVLDTTGAVSISVVATTDPGTTPTGGRYKVEEWIDDRYRRYLVTVPHDQGSTLPLAALELGLPLTQPGIYTATYAPGY